MEQLPTLHRRRLLAAAGGAMALTAGCLGSDSDDDGTGDDGSNPDDGDDSDTETSDGDDSDASSSESTEEDSDDQSSDSTDTGDGNGDVGDGDEDGDEEEDELSIVDHDYSTLSHDGTDVPLVPIDDAIEWYENEDATFVDTRADIEFAEKHITDALYSPAPAGLQMDPIDDLPADEVLVTYCACPHSIAVRRSATLIEEGYVNVFVLEDGLDEWVDRGYSVSGTTVD